MYLLLISVTAAVLAGVGVSLVDGGWFLRILAGLVVFFLCQILIGRRLKKKIEPLMMQVRRQVEAGLLQPALETLKGMLPLGSWVPLLRPQLYAQMGVLAHHAGKKEAAIEYLGRSTRRSAEAQLLLATLHDRAGDKQAALGVLERAAPYQKKSPLFVNIHAYLLVRNDDTRGAMARLAKFTQKHGDDSSRDNLRRLENGKKLNMKPFGMQWYALGYERPPASMGQVQTARKGFRQPPKSKR